MRIVLPVITACIGSTQAGFYTNRNTDRTKLAGLFAKQVLDSGTINHFNVAGDGESYGTLSDTPSSNNIQWENGRSGTTVDSSTDDSEDEEGEETVVYPNAQRAGMGAVIYQEKKQEQIQRSGRTGSVSTQLSETTINSPQEAISEAHENDIMILSSDYMYVSNCLLRNRHATDPLRERAFELFKQTAAGDWFIVFGYVCENNWSCWKKNVQSLLAKKGEDYGAGIIGRCVSRLVREKAEGLRARRRRRRNAIHKGV